MRIFVPLFVRRAFGIRHAVGVTVMPAFSACDESGPEPNDREKINHDAAFKVRTGSDATP